MGRNLITEWSYELPTESGYYLACYGDVETPDTVDFQAITIADDGAYYQVDGERGIFKLDECNATKWARLVYRPSEIKDDSI